MRDPDKLTVRRGPFAGVEKDFVVQYYQVLDYSSRA